MGYSSGSEDYHTTTTPEWQLARSRTPSYLSPAVELSAHLLDTGLVAFQRCAHAPSGVLRVIRPEAGKGSAGFFDSGLAQGGQYLSKKRFYGVGKKKPGKSGGRLSIRETIRLTQPV
jgi:hypothetical protein